MNSRTRDTRNSVLADLLIDEFGVAAPQVFRALLQLVRDPPQGTEPDRATVERIFGIGKELRDEYSREVSDGKF